MSILSKSIENNILSIILVIDRTPNRHLSQLKETKKKNHQHPIVVIFQQNNMILFYIRTIRIKSISQNPNFHVHMLYNYVVATEAFRWQ